MYLNPNFKNTMESLFNKLWLYNDWANTSLISSLKNQSEAVPYKSIHLLSHMMNAQLIWVSRIQGMQASVAVWDDHDLDKCRSLTTAPITGGR